MHEMHVTSVAIAILSSMRRQDQSDLSFQTRIEESKGARWGQTESVDVDSNMPP